MKTRLLLLLISTYGIAQSPAKQVTPIYEFPATCACDERECRLHPEAPVDLSQRGCASGGWHWEAAKTFSCAPNGICKLIAPKPKPAVASPAKQPYCPFGKAPICESLSKWVDARADARIAHAKAQDNLAIKCASVSGPVPCPGGEPPAGPFTGYSEGIYNHPVMQDKPCPDFAVYDKNGQLIEKGGCVAQDKTPVPQSANPLPVGKDYVVPMVGGGGCERFDEATKQYVGAPCAPVPSPAPKDDDDSNAFATRNWSYIYPSYPYCGDGRFDETRKLCQYTIQWGGFNRIWCSPVRHSGGSQAITCWYKPMELPKETVPVPEVKRP